MADAVTSKTLHDGIRNLVMSFTNQSDGTGESAVKKIDVSTLNPGPDGTTPSHISIQEVSWAISGSGNVTILFDATTDDTGLICSGVGAVSYENIGGNIDPQSSGTTGDVFFTTTGFSSGDSYNITIVAKKKD